jgi:hypothetical protein
MHPPEIVTGERLRLKHNVRTGPLSVAMLICVSEVRTRREIVQANFHKRAGFQAPFPHHQHQS